MTVLSVAYPFARVSSDSIGGAEQIAASLDRSLVLTGHRSIVIAAAGSEILGELVSVPVPAGIITESTRAEAERHHRRTIDEVLARERVDIVHCHGLDFFRYLPEARVPVLATLHLPISFYPREIFSVNRPDTWLHCVSASQQQDCPTSAMLLPPIPNGVDIPRQFKTIRRGGFALALGRICPEKGFHLAIDAARQAAVPLILGGAVYPYQTHIEYFEKEICPRLDDDRVFAGALARAQKLKLMAQARCLLIPSLVAETSSLVAMEALASGLPVIAFPAGALADIVEHGRTGFLVSNVEEMSAAIRETDRIDRGVCRRTALQSFSSETMFRSYLAAYRAAIRKSAL